MIPENFKKFGKHWWKCGKYRYVIFPYLKYFEYRYTGARSTGTLIRKLPGTTPSLAGQVDNFVDIPGALTIHRLPMLPHFSELPAQLTALRVLVSDSCSRQRVIKSDKSCQNLPNTWQRFGTIVFISAVSTHILYVRICKYAFCNIFWYLQKHSAWTCT